MAEASATMDEFGAKNELTGAKVNKVANKVANGIIGLAVVGGATAAKMAMDFQTAVTQLVTGAGESEKNIKLVSDGILSMAGTVGQTPQELAKGLYLIESAGYHGAAGLSVLKAAAEGAVVGAAPMTDVSNALTTALHDYNIPASKAGQVTSALIETVASGKTHLSDLATSLGKVMPQAAALGINFQPVTGGIATMTNAGLSARLASMHLSNTLLALSAPSATAAKSMASVGLTTQQVKDTLTGPAGLQGALQLIEQHVSSTFPKGSVASVQALKNIMGGTAGYSTALMLTGANAKTFETNVANIGERLGATTPKVQGFALAQKDLKFQLDQLKGSGSAALIGIGQWLLPKLSDVASWASGVFAYFKKNPLMGTIASDAAIAAFGLAIAVKLKNAVSSVLSAGSSIWQGVKSILGKFGIGSGAQTVPLDANTAALRANTDALLGKSGAGAGTSAAEGAALGGGAEAAGGAAAGSGLAMVAAPLMVAGAGIALGMIMARDKSIAPLTKGGGNVFGGRGGGASTGIFEQQKNSQVHVSNLSDIAPALTPIFGSLPGKTGQSVSAAIKGVKLQAKVEDDGSGKATAEHTSIISGLTSSHLPLLSTQTSAHLPSIHQNTQTTADRVGTTNGHMMELIGAVKAPPKVNIKVTVA
jgi:TP901 family phage tail tape measure protein